MARCTKWHPVGGLGNPAHIVWGRDGNFGRTSFAGSASDRHKPGPESFVVSQVMADTLARLPLEGCRDT